MGEASDRFFEGIELAKKFPNLPIIFTSGLLPWSNIALSEGEFLANYAIKNFDIDQSRIHITDIVKNTFEEASEISRINNIKNIFPSSPRSGRVALSKARGAEGVFWTFTRLC